MEVNVHEAKTNFSELLRRVALGEEITIAKAGVPVAKLIPFDAPAQKRTLGMDAGKIWMADDFDGPLPDDLLAAFYGEDEPSGKNDKGKNPKKKPRKKR
ncbi:MAG TPA: type II toxin-antitoxin system Phd/YefM family antitoxin [Candidatus Angelobacter sp.]|nr:type II toxin-antitoxin system Phd/YefM family antitoxin [Candidatus Angelobacter sp.]